MEDVTKSSSRLSRLASLPTPLVYSIFTYAATKSTTLKKLAKVSHEWREHAQNVASHEKLCSWTIKPTLLKKLMYSRRALLELRRQLTLRRAFLRELSIHGCRFKQKDRAVPVATWCAILAQVPQVEMLTISKDPYDETPPYGVPIIVAATQQCPRLQSLSLPQSHGQENAEALLAVVLDSLPAWAPHGGLREVYLDLAFTELADPAAKARQFVLALAANCPRLEIVGNYDTDLYEEPTDEQRWSIDLETWERFCVSCSQLTLFDWSGVPFATPFFEVFGHVAKPHLDRLAITCQCLWHWDPYFHQHPDIISDFSAAAQNPQAALLSCPNLKELVVSDACHCGVVGKSVFGDEFVEAAAQRCRQLERFDVDPLTLDDATSSYRQSPPTLGRPIPNFTDRAMQALATLPRLWDVTLHSVNITGDGLFALVVENAASGWKWQRKYRIVVGDRAGTNGANAFYRVVHQFMKRLAEWPADELLPVVSQRVVLRLLNASPDDKSSNGRLWSHDFMTNLHDVVGVVRRQHPAIGIRVVAHTPEHAADDATRIVAFKFLEEVDVYTAGAAIPRHWANVADGPAFVVRKRNPNGTATEIEEVPTDDSDAEDSGSGNAISSDDSDDGDDGTNGHGRDDSDSDY